MAVSLNDLRGLTVRNVVTKKDVEMGSFWESQQCVIFFMRRFGCHLCRLGARDLSLIAPELEAAGVRLIGIAPEELGADEFISGEFFKGEVYVDHGKKTYEALKYKKYNALNILPTLVTSTARAAFSRAKKMGIPGNIKGDGLQTGGLIVVSGKDDKILFEFRQHNVADQPSNADIMKSLGLEYTEPEATSPRQTDCSTGTCELP